MKSLKVFISSGDDYKNFVIHDVEIFLMGLMEDSKVIEKYKNMDEDQFIEWAKDGVTPKQFDKLQALNSL